IIGLVVERHESFAPASRTAIEELVEQPLPGAGVDARRIGQHAVEIEQHGVVVAWRQRNDLTDPAHIARNASMPGNDFPSNHSRKAPPAVDTKVKSLATPACFSAATVSPSPATERKAPVRVKPATVRAIAGVPRSKGVVSKAPSGPFHTSVRAPARRSPMRVTVSGPISRIISSAPTA